MKNILKVLSVQPLNRDQMRNLNGGASGSRHSCYAYSCRSNDKCYAMGTGCACYWAGSNGIWGYCKMFDSPFNEL